MHTRWMRRALAIGAGSLVLHLADTPDPGSDAQITDAHGELRRGRATPLATDSPAVSSTARLALELASLERETLTPLTRVRAPAVTRPPASGIPISRLDRARQRATETDAIELGELEARPEPKPADDLSSLASTRASVRLGDSGFGAVVPGPSVKAATPTVISGAVSDAARVVAGLRSGFRSCYATSLKSDPSLAGALSVTIELDGDGRIAGVRTQSTGNLPPSLVACIASRVRAARFTVDGASRAVLTLPVTFVPR